MKKEEVLLHAIGMLPDEMVVQDVTEELLEGAAGIEKEADTHKVLRRCSPALAAAACFAVIITSVLLLGKHGIWQPDTANDSNINILKEENGSSSVNSIWSSEKHDNIKFFVYKDEDGTEQQKSYTNDNSGDTGRKEVVYGKTVKLPSVKQVQDSSTSKKAKETEYIILGMDRDFYFTVYGGAGKTYILNGKSRKKHFIDGDRELCKAGNKVYFDLSAGEAAGSTASIEKWDKEGKEVTAYIDLYLKNGKNLKPAGRFYIGKEEKNKQVKGKEGEIYYGFLEIKDGD